MWLSSSISGPVYKLKPIRWKISTISFFTSVNGWRVPSPTGYAVRVKSRLSVPVSVVPTCSRKAFIFSVATVLSSFIFMPTAFFCSFATSLKAVMRAFISPFLLRYFSRSCSTSSAFWADNAETSLRSSSILSNIIL